MAKSKKQKREEAAQRDAERAKRTDAQQLTKIQNAGHWDCREEKRLNHED